MAARNPTPLGQRFNRLTIIADAPCRPGNNNRRALARCDCGTEKTYVLSEVVLGKTRSCGCIHREGVSYRGHGHTAERKRSPEFESWASMMTRCTNPKSRYFAYYGGRGISICKRWTTFANFLADMGARPEGTTLDRHPNRDGNYEPGNCRWATKTEQANNMASNTHFEFDGRSQTIAEWAAEYGLAYNTFIARLHRLKWPIERALKTPPRRSYPR
jgi:hypothetical protein